MIRWDLHWSRLCWELRSQHPKKSSGEKGLRLQSQCGTNHKKNKKRKKAAECYHEKWKKTQEQKNRATKQQKSPKRAKRQKSFFVDPFIENPRNLWKEDEQKRNLKEPQSESSDENLLGNHRKREPPTLAEPQEKKTKKKKKWKQIKH